MVLYVYITKDKDIFKQGLWEFAQSGKESLYFHFQIMNQMKYIWSSANEQVFFLNTTLTVFALNASLHMGLAAQAACIK